MQNYKILLLHIFFILNICYTLGQGVVIPTNESQTDFLKAYKLVLEKSENDYRSTSTTMDDRLFPLFGEFSVYWQQNGNHAGSFVFPGAIPTEYASITSSEYSTYNWTANDHYAIHFKKHKKRIAVFRSEKKQDNHSVSWEAVYFKNMFNSYLTDDIYYFVDEKDLAKGLSVETKMLIIPSFASKDGDNKFHIDRVLSENPAIRTTVNQLLATGGTLYTEGNAVYFVEALGNFPAGTVDFNSTVHADPATGLIPLEINHASHPLAFAAAANNNQLYANVLPGIELPSAQVFASLQDHGTPTVFAVTGEAASGGRIVCNTGLPTVGGTTEIEKGSRQLQWTLNTLLYAFSGSIDVTRSVRNQIPDGITAGKNAISYDRCDTFNIKIKIRNLSAKTINDIQLTETIREYFTFVDVVSENTDYTINGKNLYFNGLSLPAHSETEIEYRLKTPLPEDSIHSKIDDYLVDDSYIYASQNTTRFTANDGVYQIKKKNNYADVMFSAYLAADTDLNWKNFLGLEYQPFKVFMILENKERTSALGTKYTQYIPKDVPFYWSDKSINIPVLKTPGGKYVDILKGSNSENNPEFDMDSDGDPDVWLDTASIYPKGYTIVEEEVYWLNPWAHLRDEEPYYEDIDHDGVHAQDTDGDGIVDIEEPGDKIRVWKVTWNLDEVPGYQIYDPFCSYEIWVDPPDLVPLSAGIGFAHDSISETVDGMFYPYQTSIPSKEELNSANNSWKHWMQTDDEGNIIWKQFIYQSIDNYEGFTFIDTVAENYRLLPTDRCIGSAPQPHREFIAVLSLGGEEIDMQHYQPSNSPYSKLEYETIFDEKRQTPIRTTYTYYAPLPNPLQFEYLSNNYVINSDTSRFLPKYGTVDITFDVEASTEYTYYWIRNVGHDVDYNDPSEAIEGIDKLGDGVFGYMVYDIPKGMGGYRIHLPKNDDGSYNINALLEVDGKPFEKWIDNENTGSQVEVIEDQFQYHIYIPQLLIPPALDDDNLDGTDDWIDDRGDRFHSTTGFHHDSFMPDNGEDWLQYPETPFEDDIYGTVESGWYAGEDNTYGDDFFEKLGTVHFRIHAQYEGLGREGPVELSKGGWLVVEEIFGGSPWVIFSHTLSGYAKGVEYEVKTSPNPDMVKYGVDTIYLKHKITDVDEPHDFNYFFDPYHVSYGYGDATFTTYAGGKDPCSLIEPAIVTSTIIDPDYQNQQITLIPYADAENPRLAGFPKTVQGTFLEVRIEAMNGTDDNWINTVITPILDEKLGNTKKVMSYMAYPRPLVPGDDIGAFKAGWRFNEPEDEVLVLMGDTLPLLQPSRRAYFITLFQIDENLENGVYDIGFKASGKKVHYDGTVNGNISYELAPAKFSITERNNAGNITEYQKIVIGQGALSELQVQTGEVFHSMQDVRWSLQDVNHTDFESMTNTLPTTVDEATGTETIDLSAFDVFPKPDTSTLFILQRGEVHSFENDEDEPIVATGDTLLYTYSGFEGKSGNGISKVTAIGPKIVVEKVIYKINGRTYHPEDTVKVFPKRYVMNIEAWIKVSNKGNDISQNTKLTIDVGSYFVPYIDSLPENCEWNGDKIDVNMGSFIPGDKKELKLWFSLSPNPNQQKSKQSDDKEPDILTVIEAVDVVYNGTAKAFTFEFTDEKDLEYKAFDFKMHSISGDSPYITRGMDIILSAIVENQALQAGDIEIAFYVIQNSDTTLLQKQTIDSLDRKETIAINVPYSVPETTNNDLQFMAIVDTPDAVPEILENNNALIVQMPFIAPEITIEKSIKKVNERTVLTPDTLHFMPQEKLEFTAAVKVSNTGNDAALNVKIEVTIDENLQPVTTDLPGACTYSNNTLTITIDELDANDSLTYYIPLEEIIMNRNSVNEGIPVFGSLDATFIEKTSERQREISQTEHLIYDAKFHEIYDLVLVNISSNQSVVKSGSSIILNVNAENHALAAGNVWLRVHALEGKDTITIHEEQIAWFTINSPISTTINYTVPDTAFFVQFLAEIDADDAFSEVTEDNNSKTVKIPLSGVDALNDVSNYPNPFDKVTWFTYSLSREMTDVKITVFTSARQVVGRIENCPSDIGFHAVEWSSTNLNTGLYYFQIEATDFSNRRQIVPHKFLIIRMK